VATATIPRFREISGIGRGKIYEMRDAGEPESVHLGARRLIVIGSYRRLLAQLRESEGSGRRRDYAAETRAAGE